jgi:hypothetical protein
VPFGNPIIGGQSKLIREAIQSPNYLPGVSGWSINRDGTAEFASGTFRGPISVTDPNNPDVTLGGIDAQGSFSGPDGYFSDDIFIQGIAVDGTGVSSPNIPRIPGGGQNGVGGGIIDSLPYGLVASGPFLVNGARTVAPGVVWGLCSQAFQAEEGRMYCFRLTHIKVSGTVSGGFTTVSLRANVPGFSGDQTATSPPVGGGALFAGYLRVPHLASTYDIAGDIGPIRCGAGLEIPFSGLVQLAIDLTAGTQTVSYSQPASSFPYYARFDVYDVGPIISSTSGFLDVGAGSSSAPTRNYTKSYACSDSGSYDSGGSYISFYGSEMVVGAYSGSGIRKSMAIFPSMTADLAGATITGMSITFHDHHTYYNSGASYNIGLHGNSTLPGTYNSGTGSIISGSIAKGATKTVTIPSAYWAGFISGAYRGFNMSAPSTSLSYYSKYDGNAWSYEPKITVSYTK